MPPDALDDRDRALMILHRGSDEWALPGGGLEGGERFEEAAVREVREETSVECSLGDPYLVRHLVGVSQGERDERLHALAVFFDGTYESGEIAVQPGELAGAAWFAEPPARMARAYERRARTFFPKRDGQSTVTRDGKWRDEAISARRTR